MSETKWLEAEGGVRRSNILRCESEETDDMTEGECGEKAVLYVQEWVGNVSIEAALFGFH